MSQRSFSVPLSCENGRCLVSALGYSRQLSTAPSMREKPRYEAYSLALSDPPQYWKYKTVPGMRGDLYPLISPLVYKHVAPNYCKGHCRPGGESIIICTGGPLTLELVQNKTTAFQEVPIQTPGENEILVKVKAVAINPTDWKRSLFRIPISGRSLNRLPLVAQM